MLEYKKMARRTRSTRRTRRTRYSLKGGAPHDPKRDDKAWMAEQARLRALAARRLKGLGRRTRRKSTKKRKRRKNTRRRRR